MNTVVASTFKANVSEVSRHLNLAAGQVLRLKDTTREIKIISGVAWVSYAGEDIVLNAGEHTHFSPNRDIPVISAMGNTPLLFDASR
jgi:hypothetical protein